MEMNTNTKTVGFSNIESDDVVCVRGQAYYHHSGNQIYRKVIDLAKNLYMNAQKKITKTRIVSGIIDNIDGRFIKLVGKGKNSTFVICEEAFIREKVTQSLRNALSFKYSSSTTRKRKRKAKAKKDGERYDKEMIIWRAKEKEKKGKLKKAPVPIVNSPGINYAVGIPTVSARTGQRQEHEQSEIESMIDGGRIENALKQSINDYDQRNIFRSSIHTTSNYLTDSMNISSHQMSIRSIQQQTYTEIPSLTSLSNTSRRQLIECTNSIIRQQNQSGTGANYLAYTQDHTVLDEKDDMSRRQLRTICINDLNVKNKNNNNNNKKNKYHVLDCDNNNCRKMCSMNADTPLSFSSLSQHNEDIAAVTNELLLNPVVAVVKAQPSPHDDNYNEEKATIQIHQQQQQQQHEQQQSEDLHPYMSLYPVLRNYNTLKSVSSESSSTIQQQKYSPCIAKKETAVIEGIVTPAVYPIAAA